MEGQDHVEDLPDSTGIEEEDCSRRESRVTPEVGLMPLVESMSQNEQQLGNGAPTSPRDQTEGSHSPVTLNSPQPVAESEFPPDGCFEEPILDHQSDSPLLLRRSTRCRRPGQILTYPSLGHPTYQSRPSVNVVNTYPVPFSSLWYPQPYATQLQDSSFVQLPYQPFLHPICSY